MVVSTRTGTVQCGRRDKRPVARAAGATGARMGAEADGAGPVGEHPSRGGDHPEGNGQLKSNLEVAQC